MDDTARIKTRAGIWHGINRGWSGIHGRSSDLTECNLRSGRLHRQADDRPKNKTRQLSYFHGVPPRGVVCWGKRGSVARMLPVGVLQSNKIIKIGIDL
jgi:hypothetical protein